MSLNKRFKDSFKGSACTWGWDGDAIKLNLLSVLHVEVRVQRWFTMCSITAVLIVLVRRHVHSLQGEAVHTADPQLVVCALAGQGGHVHKEVLGLGRGPGQRLAQCSAHVTVWIFPLIAGGCTGESQLRRGKNCFDDSFYSLIYRKQLP